MPWWWTFGKVPEIEAEELLKIVEEGRKAEKKPQLVDVRTESEFNGGHIEGAVNCSLIPPWSFKKRLQALNLDNSQPVYPICLSGHRSISALKVLTSLGFQGAQLKGGMQAWRQQKLPEVKEKSKEKETSTPPPATETEGAKEATT